MLGTTLLSACFALPCASLFPVTIFQVEPLQWLLCLPLAIPAYLSAYLYTDFLDYPGIVQQTLRNVFDWQSKQDYWFPNIRSSWRRVLYPCLVALPYIFCSPEWH